MVVAMLSVTNKFFKLSVVILIVIMLSAAMLNVMAPPPSIFNIAFLGQARIYIGKNLIVII
jgi:hypothetical protein